MKVITIANRKGGVGKTTTANALIDGLTSKGYKVLGVDLDAQSNLSLATGTLTKGATVLGVLTGELEPEQAIRHTAVADIIPASTMLDGIDRVISNGNVLKDALDRLSGSYDYCIIDTPPLICERSVVAFIASNSIVIPTRADLFSLQGIDELISTINKVKENNNKGLKVAGILLTAYKNRTTIHKDIMEPLDVLAKKLDTTLFNTTIREAVATNEAPFAQKSILAYAPKSNIAEDYRAFIEELLERL